MPGACWRALFGKRVVTGRKGERTLGGPSAGPLRRAAERTAAPSVGRGRAGDARTPRLAWRRPARPPFCGWLERADGVAAPSLSPLEVRPSAPTPRGPLVGRLGTGPNPVRTDQPRGAPKTGCTAAFGRPWPIGEEPERQVPSRLGCSGKDPRSDRLNSWLDLAVTRSPTLLRAVPWAQRSFTAEFGMGSGGASAL